MSNAAPAATAMKFVEEVGMPAALEPGPAEPGGRGAVLGGPGNPGAERLGSRTASTMWMTDIPARAVAVTDAVLPGEVTVTA
eukprot:CAMPEP_0119103720 /NCGR_PEP_ID=MMETSP1180-20130426/2100_1 /TAXON_ID=3052 ORGANISM="Chlamydomonas cf sp, Strain CCMP681" /NCGR_SAMPLE_ID=MMETSP1180 /ASSEMBLY_ACC=CAM_ASM_000741 /LENGTH=81 /DNA_ID=CAMNT_0007088293 /DNA_START=908 /DNA_END=1153 /DNA_ORIENTATION=+